MTDFWASVGHRYRVISALVLRRCVAVGSGLLLLALPTIGYSEDHLLCANAGGLSSKRLQVIQAGGRVIRTCYVMTITPGDRVSVPVYLNPELVPGLVLEEMAYGVTFISDRDVQKREKIDERSVSKGLRKNHGQLVIGGATYQVFGPDYTSFRHEWIPAEGDHRVSVSLYAATSRPTDIEADDIKSLSLSFYWHTGWVIRHVRERGSTGYGLARETLFETSSIAEAVADMKRVMAWADVTASASK